MDLQQLINGISLGAVYALIAVGFAVVFSVLKFSNFSHGGVITVAAYIGYYFAKELKFSLVLTLLCSAIAGGLVGIIVEKLAFHRLRINHSASIYYFVSSITMGMLLESLIAIYRGNNFYAFPRMIKTNTFLLGGATIAVVDAMILGISILLLVLFMILIYKTKLGLSIRAAALDMNTASLMGSNVNATIMLVFFLAGSLAGVSGVFLGINYTLFPQLGQLVVKGFIASMIGGLGSIWGATLGALLLGILEVVLVVYLGAGLSPVVLFVIFLIFLLIRPQGIAGQYATEKA